MWPFDRTAKDSGRWGENLAAKHLKARGMCILGLRVRVGARDEIDLIARDGATLVFVEVKTRKSEKFGAAISSVNRKKQFHVSRAAVRYLKRTNVKEACFRFDVVEVLGEPGGAQPVIRHTPAAFSLHSCFHWPA